ncbi:MAG: hypothetical protein KJ718_05865, partial [Nanoarchaeota archaeon]|nr:hypothetical protein [Nanoarchaeota archaeon]
MEKKWLVVFLVVLLLLSSVVLVFSDVEEDSFLGEVKSYLVSDELQTSPEIKSDKSSNEVKEETHLSQYEEYLYPSSFFQQETREDIFPYGEPALPSHFSQTRLRDNVLIDNRFQEQQFNGYIVRLKEEP